MHGRVRSRMTYANVVSTFCLFVLLGGGAYAATQLPRNSVGPRQLKRNAVVTKAIADGAVTESKLTNGAVTSAKLADGAVGGSKLQAHSLSAEDFAPGVLPQPSAPGGTLPAGVTLRGIAAPASACSVGGCNFAIGEGVSFYGYQLPERPAVQVVPIGGEPTAQCPGSASDPEAESGDLCIYLVSLNPPTGGSLIVTDPSQAETSAGVNYNLEKDEAFELADGRVSPLGFSIKRLSKIGTSNVVEFAASWAVKG